MCVLAVSEAASKLVSLVGPVDAAFLLLLVAGIVVGFWTGLIWQLLCLVSVVGCLLVSYVYHPVVAQFLGAQEGDSWRNIGSSVGVFVASMLLCYLVSFLFRGLINAIKPQLPDRILGAVFGVVCWALIAGVFAFFILQYANEDGRVREYVEGSKGASAMAVVVRAFVYVLPDDSEGRDSPLLPMTGLRGRGRAMPVMSSGSS